MTEIIIDTGLKDKILQVNWEDVCGSVTSTQDIQDYGDYAVIDDFIEKIDSDDWFNKRKDIEELRSKINSTLKSSESDTDEYKKSKT